MLKIICSKNKKAMTSADCANCFSKTMYAVSRPMCVKQFIISKENVEERQLVGAGCGREKVE